MFAVLIVAAWLVLALPVALLVGRGIRVADRTASFDDPFAGLPDDLTVDDILGIRAAQPSR